MAGDWMDEDDAPLPEPFPDPLPQPAPAIPPVEERRRGGRPKGSTRSNRQQVALRIPRHVLDHFKQGGPGWQTRIIAVLEREAERR